MSDLKRILDRYYLSMSTLELRQSDRFPVAGRLPYNSVLYLDIIGFNPGITASEIAERLGVTKATVTATLNRLAAKGLVVRERSEEDGRVRHLRLSDELEDAYRLAGDTVAWMAARLSEMYPPEDVERFCEMLDSAADILDSWEPGRSGGSE